MRINTYNKKNLDNKDELVHVKVYLNLISAQSCHCQVTVGKNKAVLFCFLTLPFSLFIENVPSQDRTETGVRTHSKACAEL